jgi:hypothetical protein
MSHQTIVAVPFALVAALLVPAAARASESGVASPLTGCVVLPDDDLSDQRGRGGRPIPEPLRPAPTERELREIIHVLGRAEAESPARILGNQRLPSPTIDRMGMLVGDVRAIMAATDARESLKRIEAIPGIPARTRAWMKAQVSAIQACAQGRFVERGGDRALRQTEDLVEKLRDELGPTVFRPLRRPPPPKDPK